VAKARTARPASAVPAPRAAAHCCRSCGTRRTALLLRRQTGRRRRRRLLVEGAMHPLMPPILLRLASHDPLGPDAQLDPPHRQPRQPADTRRRKGWAIVRTDRQRQTMLLEGRREDRPHVLFVGPRHCLTAQQVAAVRVGQGERIAPPAVAGAEPALEIGAPHVVGRAHCRKRLRVGRTPPALARPADHALAPQPLPDRAGSRQRQLRRCSTSFTRSFFGPQCGHRWRNPSTACTTATSCAWPCCNGACERSAKPAAPSAIYRPSHL